MAPVFGRALGVSDWPSLELGSKRWFGPQLAVIVGSVLSPDGRAGATRVARPSHFALCPCLRSRHA